MACPHMSGAAALGLSYALKTGKRYTNDEYKAILLSSVNGFDEYLYGTKQTLVGSAIGTLYAISQSVNGRVVNTCNLSEDWIGYSTKYGDAAGDFSPLANFTKTEVKAIAYTLGLPKHLIEKVPSDGLCGQSDEERFGFTYDVLDWYIRTGIINDITIKDKIDAMHKQNLFKLQQMDSFPWGEIFCVA